MADDEDSNEVEQPQAEEAKSTRLRQIIAKGSDAPDAQTLLTELMAQWGGPSALARDLKETFDSSPEGGQTRQRFGDMIQRLAIAVTDRKLAERVRPEDLTDEELEEEATRLLLKAQKHEADLTRTA